MPDRSEVITSILLRRPVFALAPTATEPDRSQRWTEKPLDKRPESKLHDMLSILSESVPSEKIKLVAGEYRTRCLLIHLRSPDGFLEVPHFRKGSTVKIARSVVVRLIMHCPSPGLRAANALQARSLCEVLRSTVFEHFLFGGLRKID